MKGNRNKKYSFLSELFSASELGKMRIPLKVLVVFFMLSAIVLGIILGVCDFSSSVRSVLQIFLIVSSFGFLGTIALAFLLVIIAGIKDEYGYGSNESSGGDHSNTVQFSEADYDREAYDDENDLPQDDTTLSNALEENKVKSVAQSSSERVESVETHAEKKIKAESQINKPLYNFTRYDARIHGDIIETNKGLVREVIGLFSIALLITLVGISSFIAGFLSIDEFFNHVLIRILSCFFACAGLVVFIKQMLVIMAALTFEKRKKSICKNGVITEATVGECSGTFGKTKYTFIDEKCNKRKGVCFFLDNAYADVYMDLYIRAFGLQYTEDDVKKRFERQTKEKQTIIIENGVKKLLGEDGISIKYRIIERDYVISKLPRRFTSMTKLAKDDKVWIVCNEKTSFIIGISSMKRVKDIALKKPGE